MMTDVELEKHIVLVVGISHIAHIHDSLSYFSVQTSRLDLKVPKLSVSLLNTFSF